MCTYIHLYLPVYARYLSRIAFSPFAMSCRTVTHDCIQALACVYMCTPTDICMHELVCVHLSSMAFSSSDMSLSTLTMCTSTHIQTCAFAYICIQCICIYACHLNSMAFSSSAMSLSTAQNSLMCLSVALQPEYSVTLSSRSTSISVCKYRIYNE